MRGRDDMSEHIRRKETDDEMTLLREELARLQKAEQDLRKREELYRTVFETAGTAIIVFDAATVILLANSNFQRLSGYSREELEGKMSWTVFIDEQDLERMKAYHVQRRTCPHRCRSSMSSVSITRTGEKVTAPERRLIPGTDRGASAWTTLPAPEPRKRSAGARRTTGTSSRPSGGYYE
jgi:PAS domain S-box-containing protein